jgi:hypothetical protein
LKAVFDVERQGLRLADQVAGNDRDGAELAEAARCRQDDAIGHAPANRRQRDSAERRERRSAEGPSRFFLFGADLTQDGDDLAHDEWERDEDRGEHHRGQREHDLDPVRVEPRAEPSGPGVDEEERQPDDDR